MEKPTIRALSILGNGYQRHRRQLPRVVFCGVITRPKLRYETAKMGFTQSYTYMPGRKTKRSSPNTFKELTQVEVRGILGQTYGPNTHTILTDDF